MYCFYHSADLDGHCSGAIVRHFIPHVKMMPFNYGNEFPFDILHDGETVFMCDISIEKFSDMVRLNDEYDLIWIDHHKTAIDAHNNALLDGWLKYPIRGLREVGSAACELTWQFFSGLEIPDAVKLLGRYDVWDHADARTLPFQYGMRAETTSPCKDESYSLWHDLLSSSKEKMEKILSNGISVQKYIEGDFAKSCKSLVFDTEIDGLRVLAANRQGTGSKLFDRYEEIVKEYDAVCNFAWSSDGLYHVSLYTSKKDVDVSHTAKKFGGGGHAGAAGFSCKTLPFQLKERSFNVL